MKTVTSQAIGGFAKSATHPFSLSYLRRLMALRQQRLALRKLDAHQLNDLGISPRDAAIEAAKPIWNVPSHWQN